ncbi:MAG: GNAT family N-acetyltransferase [Erysipelotrichaceae bacterium]|nr:GNAT family N-acetyltransferase [Erysipelotrichaceae bacterium]MBR3693391.1 GNAT family N-acetyltransferase [Erysipelotrichales bacterium]
MIRKAIESDKKAIYHMWKEIFAQDDNGYTDYYFECLFKCENTWVVDDGGEIIATLQRNPHTMYFHGMPIKTSMILGVATLPSRRKEGHMHALMREALKQAECEEMITLIQAYDPSLYKEFGFSKIYYRNRIAYHRNQIPVYTHLEITSEVKAEELANVYQAFTKRFDGFFVRDRAYYENYFKEISAEGGQIVGYRNKNGELEGYMVYYTEKFTCEIKEIIYLNSWAFLALAGYGATKCMKVMIHTSSSEQILKLLPGGEVTQYQFAMARVNDYSIFNILFDTSVQNVEEAFEICTRPLFLHEYA